MIDSQQRALQDYVHGHAYHQLIAVIRRGYQSVPADHRHWAFWERVLVFTDKTKGASVVG